MAFSLDHIILTRFRNYPEARFDFRQRVVGFCGPNGVGKTNLLDAIHYLCFTRSYFSRTDASSVSFGSQGFRVEGSFRRQEQQLTVACVLRETGKKEIWADGDCYDKFSAHIGRLPVVMVIPDDISLVTGGSAERRNFLDTLLAQISPEYLQQLIRYNKVLQQRNGWLKQASPGFADTAVLDILDEQLVGPGESIFATRQAFMEQFIPQVQRLYHFIAGKEETPGIKYVSPLQEGSFARLLHQGRSRDLASQRSNTGVHKDDLDLQLDEQPFRTIASQGQRKSLLFALKLAEFEVLRDAKGFPPLLLLDDIFEKLDEGRMQHLLQRVCLENEGQVFITDTHRGRISDVLHRLGCEVQLEELS
jgi:DNA replication and repair protein RecF